MSNRPWLHMERRMVLPGRANETKMEREQLVRDAGLGQRRDTET